MREINFRAWNKNTEKLIDLKAVTQLALEPGLMQDGLFLPFDESIILEQYIGLKDKNGTPIFEGDIVIEQTYPMYDVGLCNYRCVVIWDADDTQFGLEMYTVSNRVRRFSVPGSINEYKALEVVGNIHEQPELLEINQQES